MRERYARMICCQSRAMSIAVRMLRAIVRVGGARAHGENTIREHAYDETHYTR